MSKKYLFILSFALSIFLSFMVTKNSFAFSDYSSCISGWSNIESVTNACWYYYYGGEPYDHGAMWINGSSNINTNSQSIDASGSSGNITAYLHGSVAVVQNYGYNAGYSAPANGISLYCGGSPCSFISGVPSYMSRGSTSSNYAWTSGSTAAITINVAGFIAGLTPDANGYYTRTIDVYRCYADSAGVTDSCYSDPSTVKLKAAQTVNYSSTSSASVPGATDNGDGTYSTNSSRVTINFKHDITSSPNYPYAQYTSIETKVDDVVKNTSSISGSNITPTYQIDLSPGESKKVCQTAYFSPTSAKFTSGGTYLDGSASGSGSSSACVTVYRDATGEISTQSMIINASGIISNVKTIKNAGENIVDTLKSMNNIFQAFDDIGTDFNDIANALKGLRDNSFDYTLKATPDGKHSTYAEIGENTKIFAGSKADDKITLLYAHAIRQEGGNLDATKIKNLEFSFVPWVLFNNKLSSQSEQEELLDSMFDKIGIKPNKTVRDLLVKTLNSLANTASKTLGLKGAEYPSQIGFSPLSIRPIVRSRVLYNTKPTYDSTLDKLVNSGYDDTIPLGTFDKSVCQRALVAGKFTINVRSIAALIMRSPIAKSPITLDETSILTSQVCAHVYRPYNFDLTLNLETTPGPIYAEQPNNNISVSVTNNENKAPGQEGNHSYTPDTTNIQVFAVTIPPETEKPSANNAFQPEKGINTTNIQNYLKNKLGGNSITKIGGEIKSLAPGASNPFSTPVSFSAEGLPLGTKVCYVAAVNYTNSSSSTENHGGLVGYGRINELYTTSSVTCQTVAKKATFQVWGGSIFSNGAATANFFSGTTGKSFGSWGDYGVISNGKIDGVISAAGLAAGGTMTAPNDSRLTKMTISNKNPGELGSANLRHSESVKENFLKRYATETTKNLSGKITQNSDLNNPINVSTRFTTFETNGFAKTVDPNTNDRYRYTYIQNDNTFISAPEALPSGVTHVIYVDGNVTISQNFTYNQGPYLNAFYIPQYIIIATGNINIAANVTQVDALLISNKIVNTCAESESEIDKRDVCVDNPLQINGAIYAERLNLTRSAGTGNDPAERITKSAGSQFWANAQSEDYARAETTYLRKLSPRY